MLRRLRANRGTQPRLWHWMPALLLLIVPFSLWAIWRLSAKPILVVVDGVEETIYTHRRTVGALLLDLDLHLQPTDQVTPPLDTPIRFVSSAVVTRGDLPFTIRQHVQPVDAPLHQARMTISLGNHAAPPLSYGIYANQRLAMQVSDRITQKRTLAQNENSVGNVLSIQLKGFDIVHPWPEARLPDGPSIQVTPIHENVVVVEETVPYATVLVADTTLPLDRQQLFHPGREGLIRTRYRIMYKTTPTGPVEVHRVPEHSWVVQEPIERQIGYGQLITPMTYTPATGSQITYWRKIRVFATSYSASTAGVSPEDPHFGYTYTGDPMRHGVVAVDPKLIPLRSKVYVPGYGLGDALDTGSAIRARRIDLGYDDTNLVLWYKWVDVYLLWPPPPPSEITWVLPN